MTNPLDELRATLLNRAKPAQQGPTPPAAAPTGPAESPYNLSNRAAQQTPGSRVPMLEQDPSVSTTQPVPTSIQGELRKALQGRTGAAGTPKTGMTTPTWPGVPSPMAPGDLPVGLPNNAAKVPPRWERFDTGQKMIDSVQQNGWSPQATMIRLLNGGR